MTNLRNICSRYYNYHIILMLNYLKQKWRSFSKTCKTLFKQGCAPHTANSHYVKIIKTLNLFYLYFRYVWLVFAQLWTSSFYRKIRTALYNLGNGSFPKYWKVLTNTDQICQRNIPANFISIKKVNLILAWSSEKFCSLPNVSLLG